MVEREDTKGAFWAGSNKVPTVGMEVEARKIDSRFAEVYRIKRFTDSGRATNNGKSPLELAGVDHLPTDWLRYLLQPSQQQHQM